MTQNAAILLQDGMPGPFDAPVKRRVVAPLPQRGPAAERGRSEHLLVVISSRKTADLAMLETRSNEVGAAVEATVTRWLARYAPSQPIAWPMVDAAVTSCD